MKSVRRHELEHNALAEWIVKTGAAVKPYQNAIVGIVLLLVVAGVVYAWYSRKSGAQTAEGWDQFFGAVESNNPANLDDFVRSHPGTEVGNMAAVMAGDVHLEIGCNQLFASREKANQQLRQAIDDYQLVLTQTRKPMLLERATFGLARAKEAMGDLNEARKYYEQVTEDWPEGAFASAATQRLADLKKPSILEMYDRFAKFEPKTPSDETDKLGPGLPPRLNENVPDEPTVFPRSTFDPDRLPKGSGETEERPAAPPKDAETPDGAKPAPTDGESKSPAPAGAPSAAK